MGSFVVLKASSAGMEAPRVVRPNLRAPGIDVHKLGSEGGAEQLIRDSGPGTYWIVDLYEPSKSRRVDATTRLSTEG